MRPRKKASRIFHTIFISSVTRLKVTCTLRSSLRCTRRTSSVAGHISECASGTLQSKCSARPSSRCVGRLSGLLSATSSFSLGNSQKSRGAMSGEYGGWLSCGTCVSARKRLMEIAVCTCALSWCSSQSLFSLCCRRIRRIL